MCISKFKVTERNVLRDFFLFHEHTTVRVLLLLSGFILVGDRALIFLVCHVLVFF